MVIKLYSTELAAQQLRNSELKDNGSRVLLQKHTRMNDDQKRKLKNDIGDIFSKKPKKSKLIAKVEEPLPEPILPMPKNPSEYLSNTYKTPPSTIYPYQQPSSHPAQSTTAQTPKYLSKPLNALTSQKLNSLVAENDISNICSWNDGDQAKLGNPHTDTEAGAVLEPENPRRVKDEYDLEYDRGKVKKTSR